MLKSKVILAAGVSAIALSGCLATTTPDELKKEAQINTFNYKVATVEHQVKHVPSWFKELPEEDDVIFAVGTASLPDLQLSIDIATIAAKRTLADRINSRLRNQTKVFISKIGDSGMSASVMSEIDQATRNIVVDADLGGYHQQEMEIIPNGTQYRSYVLLAYSDKAAQKILRNRLAKNRALLRKISATNAFKELDDQVKSVKESERKDVTALIAPAPKAVPVPKVETVQ